jgi:hypothetical protein
LLVNINEIDFVIDKVAIDLAKEALEACGMDYREWTFIENLANEK